MPELKAVENWIALRWAAEFASVIELRAGLQASVTAEPSEGPEAEDLTGSSWVRVAFSAGSRAFVWLYAADQTIALAGRTLATAGWRIVIAGCSPAVMRSLPAGLSRYSLSKPSSVWISSNLGATTRSKRSPASVGDTLRVVRASNRTPRCFSRLRMVRLTAGCDMPSFAAARVKLRSCATTVKIASWS